MDEHYFDVATLDDIVKRMDKLEAKMDQISRDISTILSTINSSQYRTLNTFIRRGDPVPFKATHDRVP